MAIEVTVRHLNVSKDLQEYARQKADELMEEFPTTEFFHVILDHIRHEFLAEMVVQAKGPTRLEASERNEDMIKAIDSASDKLERQLRKHRDKMISHHA